MEGKDTISKILEKRMKRMQKQSMRASLFPWEPVVVTEHKINNVTQHIQQSSTLALQNCKGL